MNPSPRREGAASPQKPVRVLQLVAMLQSGGPERWLVELCPAGQARGLDMDIAVVFEMDGLFARRARELHIPVYYCDGRSNPLRFIRNLRRLLREHGPYDAIHSHLHAYSGFALLAAWLEKVPARVAHSHNVVGNAGGTLVRRIYIALARSLIRMFATAGMGPSSASVADLFGSAWKQDGRWRVMPCGIDLAPFRRPVAASASRAALGIPEDALVMGSVGRLHPEKNSELMVDVLGAALRMNPRAYLFLVGEGPLKEQLEQKAQAGGYRDRLHLAGLRSDVADILRGVLDVFIFPSPPPPRGNEALPIAVIEAQAAGLPTVISDGVTSEIIIIPELVVQIPADAGAERWAETALRQARLGKTAFGERSSQQMENSEFSCTQNLRTLAGLYSKPEQGRERG